MAVGNSPICLLRCSSGKRPLALTGVGSQYLQCQKCGLAFLSRAQAGEPLERQYLEDGSSTTSYYQRTIAADRITFRRRLWTLAELQPERGRLLDVGCSIGTLMRVAREMGWQAEGLEPNPKAARLARQQGFLVHSGFLTADTVSQLPGSYHCVVMSDIIEHLKNPDEALGLVRKLLAPRGILLLSTPNLESFWCRKFQLKPMEHLFLFNSHNLRLLLEREEFEVCLLEKTSRRRALGQLTHSTTELGRRSQALVTIIYELKLDKAVAAMMDRTFKDELFVLATTGRIGS